MATGIPGHPSGFHDHRSSHAGAGGGCGRSSAIIRKISWNICRGKIPDGIQPSPKPLTHRSDSNHPRWRHADPKRAN